MNDTAILLCPHDSYLDIFNLFITALRRNYPDCPYPVILSNNTATPSYSGVTRINNDDSATWIQRCINAVNATDYRYYFVLCEDCIFADKINDTEISQLLDVIRSHSLRYCNVFPAPHFCGKPLKNGNGLRYINRQKPYGISMMATLWERELLLSEIGDPSATGWELEKRWLAESAAAPDEYFTDRVQTFRNPFHIEHLVLKGCLIPSAVRRLSKSFKMPENRESLSRIQEFKMKTFKSLGTMLRPNTRKRVKRLLSRFGVQFVSEN